MPDYIGAHGFVVLRVIGGAILFWGISVFGPKERIGKKDYLRIAVCAIFGMGLNMLAFFKGLSLSTPINSAVLITTTPIIVLILSAVLIKEKISGRKVFGIFVGLIGAVGLILFGAELRQDAPNIPLGNFLILLNSFFYGIYLILAKILISKYHPFTFMKWMFSLGILICLPFGYHELMAIEWSLLPFDIIWRITFVIIGTTFCTYLFNIFALTQLRASTLSAFVYVQPLIGILFSIALGKDALTTTKVLAASLVFLGVYLSSRRARPNP